MSRYIKSISLICLAMICFGATEIRAKKHEMHLKPTELSTVKSADTSLGDFYVLKFSVPTEIKRLRRAYLELYVDASSRTVSGYTNDTPVIEVCALDRPFSGTLDREQFRVQSVPTMRNVVAGSNKRVRVDITEIVASYISDPTLNHGLVIGSFTGKRDGIFSVRTDRFGGKGIAKLTFVYSSDPRILARPVPHGQSLNHVGISLQGLRVLITHDPKIIFSQKTDLFRQ